jgi:hypothetical protein
MAGTPFDHELAARIAHDARHDPERRMGRCQSRPLLDVELEKCSRQRAASRNQCAASDATDLFSAERYDRAAPCSLDRFDRSNDS